MNHYPIINRIPVPIARKETLEARDPNFFSTIVKDAGKVAKLVIREDQLEAREPNFLSSVVKDVGKVAKFVVREDDQRRELEERNFPPTINHTPVMGRMPFHYAREETLAARDPNFFSTIVKDAGKVAKFVVREDNLDVREPAPRAWFLQRTWKGLPQGSWARDSRRRERRALCARLERRVLPRLISC